MPERERPLLLTGSRKPPRRQVYRRRRVGAVGALVAAMIAVWFLFSLFQPLGGSGSGLVVVRIPKDTSTGQIATLLSDRDVISSAFFFKLRVKLDGDSGKFRAGTFRMRHGMSYSAALDVLTKAPALAPTTNITIDPGHTRRQVQALLTSAGFPNRYYEQTKRSALLDPTSYGAPKNTPSLEGFMWPDTYNLAKPVKIKQLIADQLTTFKREFATVNFAWAKAHGLTEYDVLITASLISEESQKPADGPKVASVIYNRLHDGMSLGLDSTVSYATGNYGTLTEKDLQSSSPWNTTNHVGLPPTPIDSPGLDDIRYAAHPASTDYLYFINRVCGQGALNFTHDVAQFDIWSQEWDQATAEAAKNHGSAEYCKHGKP